MIKNGMLTEKSGSDFVDSKGKVKKAAWYDEKGHLIADEENKHKLKSPVRVAKSN